MEELTILIDKTTLLTALGENRQRFVKSYHAVLKAYEKKVAEYQKKYADYTQKVILKQLKKRDDGEPMAPPKPEDRTKEYDLYIDMLDKHEKTTIELSESMFRRLWKDQWDWTRSHYNTMSFYASGSSDVAGMLDFYAGGE